MFKVNKYIQALSFFFLSKINSFYVKQCLLLYANNVSEWLLLKANSAIFQLYHGENKLIFNEMMMRSALY